MYASYACILLPNNYTQELILLLQAVQEQSLKIKQLEAENAALTRDRGYRGQQQQMATAGHPVIKTSALQSVV